MAVAGDGKRGETINTFTEETPRAAEAGALQVCSPRTRSLARRPMRRHLTGSRASSRATWRASQSV